MTLPRVLIVEDDDDDRFFAQRALKKAGITEIQHVGDGGLAVDYLAGRGGFAQRQLHPLPDIVLIDLKIPELDGHQLLEWIATQETLRGLKAFVLSSSGEERDRSRAKAAGAAGYFVKPLRLDDVKSILAHLSATQPETGAER